MTYADRFESIYKKSPDGIAFCPYRICPIGAHNVAMKMAGKRYDIGSLESYEQEQKEYKGIVR